MFTSPSGHKYIGQTCNLQKRITSHKNIKNSRCSVFNRAIKKYGFENFDLEILKENLSQEEAHKYEEYYIKSYNTISPNGYNLTSGGLNYTRSTETSQKMSKSKKGIKIHDETSKQKIREYQTGKHRSDETKKKMSYSKIGENNHWYGKYGDKHHSAKQYIITFPDGHEELIIGLAAFCRAHDLNGSKLALVAQGKRTHHKSFKCAFILN